MSINNLKITATLRSPLVGDPPYLDALLTYELGFKMHKFENMKFNKTTPIEKIERLPIPLTRFEISRVKVNSCSNPIFTIKTEWHDKLSKHFETGKLSLLVDPDKRKNITPGTGHLKSRWQPLHVKLIDKIVWFARGDAKECRRLLKGVVSLGYYRKIGYGIVAKWEVEKIEKNYSVFADNKIMKTLPIFDKIKNYEGYRIGYGACTPPYWHPKNFKEIAIPA